MPPEPLTGWQADWMVLGDYRGKLSLIQPTSFEGSVPHSAVRDGLAQG